MFLYTIFLSVCESQHKIVLSQGRIQDFLDGAPTQGGANLLSGIIFAENAKLKELDRGGARPKPLLDPRMITNTISQSQVRKWSQSN